MQVASVNLSNLQKHLEFDRSKTLPQICKYEFPWPYKLKEFEKELARVEVAHLFNGQLEKNNGGLKVVK